jgi:hypothetical protein
VASRVTTAGPTTKISSSATDSRENAVCSVAGSRSTLLHLVRTIEPSEGMVAPARALVTSRAQTGAPISAVAMNVTVAAAKITASGRSTRPWPKLSASRATCGATPA